MEDFDYLPAGPPDQHTWEYRRRKFDAFWMSCINEKGSITNDHVDGLKLELERCFCSGAWVAVILLAAAIAEVQLSYLDKWKKNEAVIFLESLRISEDWEWLRNRRNKLIHGANKRSANRLSVEEYRRQRDDLQLDAQKALRVALLVALNNPEP